MLWIYLLNQEVTMKTISLVFLLWLAAQTFSSAQDYYAQGEFKIAYGPNEQTEKVMRALDGDTLRLSNGQNLKLGGINTPELHDMTKLSPEAKQFGMEVWA